MCRFGEKHKNFADKFKLFQNNEFEIVSEYKTLNSSIKFKHIKCGFIETAKNTGKLINNQIMYCGGCGEATNMAIKLNITRFSTNLTENAARFRFKYVLKDEFKIVKFVKGKALKDDEPNIIEHKCGHKFPFKTLTTWLKNPECPKCKNKDLMSSGVKIIHQVLKDLEISYKSEVNLFKNPETDRYLPFDFMFKQTVIEYDGAQHFMAVRLFNDKNIHNRDLLKNHFCKINNIRMLRIDYTFNSYDEIKNIIIDFIKSNEKFKSVSNPLRQISKDVRRKCLETNISFDFWHSDIQNLYNVEECIENKILKFTMRCPSKRYLNFIKQIKENGNYEKVQIIGEYINLTKKLKFKMLCGCIKNYRAGYLVTSKVKDKCKECKYKEIFNKYIQPHCDIHTNINFNKSMALQKIDIEITHKLCGHRDKYNLFSLIKRYDQILCSGCKCHMDGSVKQNRWIKQAA